jgi:hypothetical protein
MGVWRFWNGPWRLKGFISKYFTIYRIFFHRRLMINTQFFGRRLCSLLPMWEIKPGPLQKTSRTETKTCVKLPYLLLLNRNCNISTSSVPTPFPHSMVWAIKPVQNSHIYFTFLKFFVGLDRPRVLCCRTGFGIICLSFHPNKCPYLVISPSIRFD